MSDESKSYLKNKGWQPLLFFATIHLYTVYLRKELDK